MTKSKLVKIGLSTVILLQISMPAFAAEHVLMPIEPIGNIPIIVSYMKYTARASTNLIIDLRGNLEVDINDIKNVLLVLKEEQIAVDNMHTSLIP